MRLGKHELGWLRSLTREDKAFTRGVWWLGSGRIWDTASHTIRLCESLERKGLLKQDRPREAGHYQDKRRWVVTEAGYAAVRTTGSVG